MKEKILIALWMIHVVFMSFIFPFFAIGSKSNVLGIIWWVWFIAMAILLIFKDSDLGYSDGDY